MTEIFIERALARAKEVDEYLKTHGKPIGPLHGLPISLKDQFCIKGMETIMGKYHIATACSASPPPTLEARGFRMGVESYPASDNSERMALSMQPLMAAIERVDIAQEHTWSEYIAYT